MRLQNREGQPTTRSCIFPRCWHDLQGHSMCGFPAEPLENPAPKSMPDTELRLVAVTRGWFQMVSPHASKHNGQKFT
jgi:hypothetical protein